MNSNLAFFLTCALLISLSEARLAVDFCVADPNLPTGPEGRACKNPSNVTVYDFIYTGFRTPGQTSIIFNNNIDVAFVDTFPGLNGLGLSMVRLDFGVNGVIPMHSHPRASEVLILAKGSIIAGFIDTNDVAYYKKLQVGDVIILPQGLLHFQVNVGKSPALAFVSFNNANPGIQFTSTSLFAGNLPAKLVEKTTLIDHDQVIKLRKVFGKYSVL
ncbi:auxin-binding protein ABP19b-like [Silene latifolia]|uniref:auxin-binding protein ABP19b-like n=1 Tax=Silene latifolia TaxID=37657 RepID=UPI003D7760FA